MIVDAVDLAADLPPVEHPGTAAKIVGERDLGVHGSPSLAALPGLDCGEGNQPLPSGLDLDKQRKRQRSFEPRPHKFVEQFRNGLANFPDIRQVARGLRGGKRLERIVHECSEDARIELRRFRIEGFHFKTEAEIEFERAGKIFPEASDAKTSLQFDFGRVEQPGGLPWRIGLRGPRFRKKPLDALGQRRAAAREQKRRRLPGRTFAVDLADENIHAACVALAHREQPREQISIASSAFRFRRQPKTLSDSRVKEGILREATGHNSLIESSEHEMRRVAPRQLQPAGSLDGIRLRLRIMALRREKDIHDPKPVGRAHDRDSSKQEDGSDPEPHEWPPRSHSEP